MTTSVPPGNTDRVSGRMLRTLVLWALIVVGAVGIIQYASHPSRATAEISFAAFQHELEQHNIDTVMISGTRVRGVFRNPIVVRRDTITHFSLLLPAEPTDTFTALVRKYGAAVAQDDPAQSWSVVMLTYLPYIFIFFVGALIVAFWHRQARGRQA